MEIEKIIEQPINNQENIITERKANFLIEKLAMLKLKKRFLSDIMYKNKSDIVKLQKTNKQKTPKLQKKAKQFLTRRIDTLISQVQHEYNNFKKLEQNINSKKSKMERFLNFCEATEKSLAEMDKNEYRDPNSNSKKLEEKSPIERCKSILERQNFLIEKIEKNLNFPKIDFTEDFNDLEKEVKIENLKKAIQSFQAIFGLKMENFENGKLKVFGENGNLFKLFEEKNKIFVENEKFGKFSCDDFVSLLLSDIKKF
ncbi:hypothetical protein MHBO_002278 [Bonamia ostreae]|uniref:Kinetochore protein SPC25 n=1 Tax=Bonamia ostreae TaxID=126728 RepID=A0ABV2ALT3_9EUKA